MENITEDSGVQPRRRVAEAYSESTPANILKKNPYWIFAFFAFLLLTSNAGAHDKKAKRAKKLRKKAEIAPSIEIQKQQLLHKELELEKKMQQMKANDYDDHENEDGGYTRSYSSSSVDYASARNGGDDNNDDEEAEEELETEISNARVDVDYAEEEKIEINDSMLVSAVRTMEDNAKFYLGRVFGFGSDDDDDDDFEDSSETSEDVKLTEEQLDLIAKKISERLETDVRKEFRAKADAITEEKVEEIEQVVEEDRDAEMDAHEIVEDVAEAEHMAVEDLKDEIDEEAEKIKEALPDRAKKIRDEVVEEVTGKKLDRIEEIKRRRREKHKAMVKKFREMHAKQDEYLKQKVDVSAPKKKMMVSSYDDKENSMKISKPPLNMGDEIGETMYASEDEDE
mmetsp:Transcript_18408/g.36575  ORF Transcript_18408/g.36575 Transcript_18408/m.36575 type:complete len:397 (+) Transcript_18408:205-1395(+)